VEILVVREVVSVFLVPLEYSGQYLRMMHWGFEIGDGLFWPRPLAAHLVEEGKTRIQPLAWEELEGE
jgi:hypothetical protein